MGTRALLDQTRTELVELEMSRHVYAREVTLPTTKDLLHQWRHTGTWTLNPVQFTTDFQESKRFEVVKFRLADVNYQADWWTEVPGNTRPDVGPCDYFFNGVVKNTNVPSGFPSPSKFLLLELMIDVGVVATANALAYQQSHGVTVLQSKKALPANQGYYLKFRVDGKEGSQRGVFLDFYHGEFITRLNTSGVAELYQTADYQNYTLVYTWPWALSSEVHDRLHTVLIYPHSRNKIEFYSTTGGVHSIGHYDNANRGRHGGGIYEIPGELRGDAQGNFLIQQPGPWTIRHSLEFRPHIQVSRLAFVESTVLPSGKVTAGLYDSPIDFSHPPLQQVSGQVEGDLNGGSLTWNFYKPDSELPFQSDGKQSVIQFGVGFSGLGDLANGAVSSTSPEFYGYTIDKPAGFETIERTPIVLRIRQADISYGETVEGERLTLTLPNDLGECADFEERAEIPLRIYDDQTGIVYFEGTAAEVETTECRAVDPGTVRIEAQGMADNMIRTQWSHLAPDFGKDPKDKQMRGWLVGDTIRRTFGSGGFDPATKVLIEEEADYLQNFRLWNNPASGGSKAGSGSPGGPFSSYFGNGHIADETPLRRWKPREGTGINEFAEFIIRDVLGWHYVWSRKEGIWRVYKRPDPKNALDVSRGKFTPKAEFYTDGYEPTGDYPAYRHSGLRKWTQRPICTTVVILTLRTVTAIKSRSELEDILKNAAKDIGAEASNLTKTDRGVYTVFDNPKGYLNDRNNPPDIRHPDWMGKKRLRLFPAAEATTDDAIEWIGRRFYEDYTQGHIGRTLEADWGDPYTAYLRKWDVVLINRKPHYIQQIEPQWHLDVIRRAKYHCVQCRPDARPPR